MKPGRKFEWYIPIAKATPTEDGGFDVEGVATDEREDLQDEVIKAAGVERSVDYLNTFGVVNLDHGKVAIGRVNKAWMSTPREVRRRWGWDVVGRPTCLKAHINPVRDPLLAPEDLKTAHYYRSSGMPLGFSIQGTADTSSVVKSGGRNITVTTPKLVSQVALTLQPVNPGARAIAKSLTGFAVGEITDSAEPATDDQAPVDEPPVLIMSKGVTAGDGTDAASMTGGRALQPESLLGGPQQGGSRCPHCGKLIALVDTAFASRGGGQLRRSVSAILDLVNLSRGTQS